MVDKKKSLVIRYSVVVSGGIAQIHLKTHILVENSLTYYDGENFACPEQPSPHNT